MRQSSSSESSQIVEKENSAGLGRQCSRLSALQTQGPKLDPHNCWRSAQVRRWCHCPVTMWGRKIDNCREMDLPLPPYLILELKWSWGCPRGQQRYKVPVITTVGEGTGKQIATGCFWGLRVPDSCHTPGSPSPSPSAVNWREEEGLSTRHSFRLLNPVVKAAEGPMDGMR